jgi:hypothetical protein
LLIIQQHLDALIARYAGFNGLSSPKLWMRGTAFMKRVLLKTLHPVVVMMALCAASVVFSPGAYAIPIPTPATLSGTSNQINLAEVAHCSYYGCGYYDCGHYRPYVYYRPYRHYRTYRHYRSYFSYPYHLPPPVR